MYYAIILPFFIQYLTETENLLSHLNSYYDSITAAIQYNSVSEKIFFPI
jgi:hypothetical protein